MSLGVEVPRRSALGVTWAEDFSRGRLGVRKNQGAIIEAAGNPIGFVGPWADFPGNVGSYIQYPHLITVGHTAVTVLCWLRFSDTAVGQAYVAQYDFGGTGSFILHSVVAKNGSFYAVIGGTIRAINTTMALDTLTGDILLAGRWSSGSSVDIFVNGELDNQTAGTYVGTLSDSGYALRVGNSQDGLRPSGSMQRDAIVDLNRAWSDDEIRDYYRRSIFH